MTKIIEHSTREEWLADRGRGIGASEAAQIMGLSPWGNATSLWEIKRGLKKPKDISGNAAVDEGNRIEPIMRQLFEIRHPELRVDYRPYDMLYQGERPWLFATLDGELTAVDGSKGILEIKRHEMGSKADREAWNNRIPDHYFCQICHQFLATDYNFSYLFAGLIYPDGNIWVKSYYFDKADCAESMEALLAEETKFWESVQSGKMPPMKLTL